MRTRLTSRGQTSIPSRLRRALGLAANSQLEWSIEGNTLRAIPIPDDPIAALRGSGKPGEVGRLLADRRRERARGE